MRPVEKGRRQARLSAESAGDPTLIGAEVQALSSGGKLSRLMQAQRLPGCGGSALRPPARSRCRASASVWPAGEADPR